ncbi:hypothetical protein [Streptomyces sp. NPDC048155]|uniref:hypothetical protein n=1 Tax=Streptomyces sp. NPDC048155 TaxID=3154818 RepID=UPI0033CF1DE7
MIGGTGSRRAAHACLEQSSAPAWGNGASSRSRYVGTLVRLWVRGRLEGHRPRGLTYKMNVSNL